MSIRPPGRLRAVTLEKFISAPRLPLRRKLLLRRQRIAVCNQLFSCLSGSRDYSFIPEMSYVRELSAAHNIGCAAVYSTGLMQNEGSTVSHPRHSRANWVHWGTTVCFKVPHTTQAYTEMKKYSSVHHLLRTSTEQKLSRRGRQTVKAGSTLSTIFPLSDTS